MLALDMDREFKWDTAKLTAFSDFGIHSSMACEFKCLHEPWLLDRESVFWSVADLLALAICSMKVMIRASILEVRVGFLVSTMLSNNTHIVKVGSQLSSNSSKFDAGTAELG